MVLVSDSKNRKTAIPRIQPGFSTLEGLALGPDAVALALLAAARRIAELQRQTGGTSPSPATPSGMIPVYLKPNAPADAANPNATQAVLMNVYRTLRLRGHDPLRVITKALRTCLQTGQLPPLPAAHIANG